MASFSAKKEITMDKFNDIESFSHEYKHFLNACKTERETAAKAAEMAKAAGFVPLDTVQALHPGDKVFTLYKNKAAALFVIGKKSLKSGMRLLCAHTDAPRLDIRPCPLYEKDGLGMLRTHYYGGIKKYQWATIPLAIHGIIVKKGGERITVSIGENENEPVLYISDLPKHLSAEQAKKPMGDGINGENLNLVAASLTAEEEQAGLSLQQKLLALLNEYCGIDEADLLSAELEIVPAGKARDAGLDGSLIAAYGHDDRSCVYAGLQAILHTDTPEHTAGLLLLDKEEVGNQGATGMKSHILENLTARLLRLLNEDEPLAHEEALEHSQMLSADVVLAMDPNYSHCFAPGNTAHLGHGPAIVKYAGHFGKKDANDANAEFLALLRDVFDEAGIRWQTGEYGIMDLGGGGTMAPLPAQYGMETADCGIPLLSMHAPYELASKADVYEASRAYATFLASDKDIEQYQ